jgi:hypothetical protein
MATFREKTLHALIYIAFAVCWILLFIIMLFVCAAEMALLPIVLIISLIKNYNYMLYLTRRYSKTSEQDWLNIIRYRLKINLIIMRALRNFKTKLVKKGSFD